MKYSIIVIWCHITDNITEKSFSIILMFVVNFNRRSPSVSACLYVFCCCYMNLQVPNKGDSESITLRYVNSYYSVSSLFFYCVKYNFGSEKYMGILIYNNLYTRCSLMRYTTSCVQNLSSILLVQSFCQN